MEFKKNIIFNFIGTGVVGVVNILALSEFTKSYGFEAWGVISVFIALISLMMLADLGVSQIYIREYRTGSDNEDLFKNYSLTLFFAGMFFTVLTYIICITADYLKFSDFRIYEKTELVAISLLIFNINLQNNFYYTHYSAAQNQLLQNSLWSGFVIIKNISIYLVASFVSKAPILYLLTWLLCSILELFVNIKISRLSVYPTGRISFSTLYQIFNKCGLLSVAICIGILVFYLDRIILPSRILASDFGVYSVIVTVGLYFLQLQYPIMKATFPYLAQKFHSTREFNFNQVLAQMVYLFIFITPFIIISILYTHEILAFFSINDMTYSNSTLLLRSIIVSSLINALYHVIYQQIIIYKKDRLVLAINSLGLLNGLLIFYCLDVADYFLLGSIFWILSSCLQLIIGLFFLYSLKFLNLK